MQQLRAGAPPGRANGYVTALRRTLVRIKCSPAEPLLCSAHAEALPYSVAWEAVLWRMGLLHSNPQVRPAGSMLHRHHNACTAFHDRLTVLQCISCVAVRPLLRRSIPAHVRQAERACGGCRWRALLRSASWRAASARHTSAAPSCSATCSQRSCVLWPCQVGSDLLQGCLSAGTYRPPTLFMTNPSQGLRS